MPAPYILTVPPAPASFDATALGPLGTTVAASDTYDVTVTVRAVERVARGRAASALLAAFVLLSAVRARAIPTVRKTAGGPYVTQSGGRYMVPAGQPIEWDVRICNDTATPVRAQVQDFLHSGDCVNHQDLLLACPPTATAGGTVQSCDDAAPESLSIDQITIAANDCAEVRFETTVDLLMPLGTGNDDVCNIAFYTTDATSSNPVGQTSPPTGSGCSCVTVLPPLPTRLDFALRAVPDEPPLRGGDASAGLLLTVDATNLTPRPIAGRLVLPLPSGLVADGVSDCPAGATCTVVSPQRIEVAGLALPQDGSFHVVAHAHADCASLGAGTLCMQASFEPVEAPGTPVLSDDPGVPGQQPTCVAEVEPDFLLTKTWRLVDDANGNGVPDTGDRIRFLLRAWNRGAVFASGVEIADSVPLGFNVVTPTTDSAGSYVRPQAKWTFPEVGAGSFVDAWLEATMASDAVAPNRARLTTAIMRTCGSSTVLSDDPLSAPVGDSTPVNPPGAPSLAVSKSLSFVDLDGDTVIDDGETVRFSLTVSNLGNATATDAVLDDPLPACLGDISGVVVAPAASGSSGGTARALRITALGGPDGLSPDESVTVSFDTVAGTAAGCCNQATASWAAGAQLARSDDPRASGAAEPTCLQPASPALELTKAVRLIDEDLDGVITTADSYAYDVTIRNDGAPVAGVLVTDEIPAGLPLDPTRTQVTPPSGTLTFAPPPRGLHGKGRIELRDLALAQGASVTLSFGGAIPSVGTWCNSATALAPGLVRPLVSEDVAAGGPTCFTVSPPPPPPILGVTLSGSGALFTGCALAGEEAALSAGWSVGGTGSASNVKLTLSFAPPDLPVIDAGTGMVGRGQITWALGTLASGTSGSVDARLATACGQSGGISFAASLSAANAPSALAAPVQLTISEPAVAGTLVFTHADSDRDGSLDPGEVLRVELTLTETGGCDAAGVAAALDLDPALSVVNVFDGGVASPPRIDWNVPAIAAGGSVVVAAEVTLDAAAPDCAVPSVSGDVSWGLSPGTACLEQGSATVARMGTPPGPCVNPTTSDLLRDDRVTDLAPPTPPLATILDAGGVDDSCAPGARTRIDPAMVVASDVASLLATGVVVARDALPVGTGRGALVFYEVSRSCATIHACKTDADGDPVNGRESVLITTSVCP